MQVHNHDARQTLFALNHWIAGAHADLGIGNDPTGNAPVDTLNRVRSLGMLLGTRLFRKSSKRLAAPPCMLRELASSSR